MRSSRLPGSGKISSALQRALVGIAEGERRRRLGQEARDHDVDLCLHHVVRGSEGCSGADLRLQQRGRGSAPSWAVGLAVAEACGKRRVRRRLSPCRTEDVGWGAPSTTPAALPPRESCLSRATPSPPPVPGHRPAGRSPRTIRHSRTAARYKPAHSHQSPGGGSRELRRTLSARATAQERTRRGRPGLPEILAGAKPRPRLRFRFLPWPPPRASARASAPTSTSRSACARSSTRGARSRSSAARTMLPEVRAAMAAAAQHYVHLDELAGGDRRAPGRR